MMNYYYESELKKLNLEKIANWIANKKFNTIFLEKDWYCIVTAIYDESKNELENKYNFKYSLPFPDFDDKNTLKSLKTLFFNQISSTFCVKLLYKNFMIDSFQKLF